MTVLIIIQARSKFTSTRDERQMGIFFITHDLAIVEIADQVLLGVQRKIS